jgi:hypothetical protein
MLMGAINDHGITCVLHGWFFDTERMCSVWDDDSVWADGYPAREYAGLYWAYLGEEPAPTLPGDEMFGPIHSGLRVSHYPPFRGNWLLDAPKHLPAGPLWCLTPIDREQTLVFSVERSTRAAGDGGEPETVAAPAIEPNPNTGPIVTGDILAPWGAVISAGSQADDLHQFVLEQATATPGSTQEPARS